MICESLSIAELIQDGKLVINDGYRAKNEELTRLGGFPFARAGNIDNGFHFSESDYIPADDIAKVGIKVSHCGDVVFTSKGTVGRFAFVREHTPKFVYSPQLCFWRSLDKSLISPRWLYYWMNGPDFFQQYKGVAGQTDMAEYVSLQDQRRMHISVPPLPTQKAIAHILGTLDDKIELLRSMNETLEAMARALFKSWFIDFDPVRKKAEGQPTGLPPEIDALFPDSFEDSELGEIPKGWAVGKLKDVVAQRVVRAEASVETAKKPYLPIDCITSNCLFLSDKKDGSDAQTSLTSFFVGDIVFGAMRPYFHKVCIAPFDGTTRTTAFVLYPIDTHSYSFVVLTLHSESTIEYATTHSTGTTIPYASWKNSLEKMPVILPNKDILKAFDAMVRPMLDEIRTSHFHYEVVAKARNSLLPKLISGEIELSDKDISKIMEPAK